jgi:thioredoxin 1
MITEVSADTFEKEILKSDKPVLVDFWGPRCGPCLALMPAVEGLEEKYKDRIKITKIDASKNRRLCLNLKVLGLPTYILYKDGKEVERLARGDLNIAEIEESVKRVLTNHPTLDRKGL